VLLGQFLFERCEHVMDIEPLLGQKLGPVLDQVNIGRAILAWIATSLCGSPRTRAGDLRAVESPTHGSLH
jgi:hypothetical protein